MAKTQDVDETAGLPKNILDQGKKAEALQAAIIGNTGKGPVTPPEAALPAPVVPAEGAPPATPPAVVPPVVPPVEGEPAPAPVEIVPAQAEAEPVVPATPAPAATPAPVVPAAQPPDTWEQKYRVLQGKYDKEILGLTTQVNRQNVIVTDQSELMSGLLRELDQLRTAPGGPQVPQGSGELPAEAQPVVTTINPENYEGFGQEIVDLAKEVKDLRERNQQLETKTEQTVLTAEQTAKQGMYKYLDENVSNWRTMNGDQQFLMWLRQFDPLSGAVRQQLLDYALANFDGARVATFFQTYLQETGGGQPIIDQSQVPVAPIPPAEPVVPAQPAAQPVQPVILPAESLGGELPPVDGAGAIITREQYLMAQKEVQTGRMTGKEFEDLSNRYLKQQLAAQKAAAGGVR